VHHLRRRGDERARLQQLLLVVHEHGHAALEHVERVHVAVVEVGRRAVARIGKVRLRDRELVEACFEDDPSAEERFAFARSEHDSLHCERV
jgi:hypothetical protein